MKSSWGNVKVVTSRYDRLIYAFPRKKYTWTHPPPTTKNRRNIDMREKAAVIKLTRHGYSINMLAKLFRRSTSFIHRIVRTSITRGINHFVDKRKLPNVTRLQTASARWRTIYNYWAGWVRFIKGVEAKPP